MFQNHQLVQLKMMQPIKRPSQPPKKRRDCQIEIQQKGDKKVIKFKGDCSKEQIEVARNSIKKDGDEPL